MRAEMNPHDNTPLYNAYADEHKWDQIADELGITFRLAGGKWRIVPLCLTPNIGGDRVHHLWSVGQRPDYRSNLIKVCGPTHGWIHAHPQAGRVVCMLAKTRYRLRTADPRDFDLREMFAVSGKHLAGWAEGIVQFAEPIIEAYRFELVERLRGLAREAA